MSHLAVGDQAPLFRLRDERGNTVVLEEFKGKQPVVLIFYPGDDTPGCIKQLCAVRDDWKKFSDAGIAVFGVNHADEKSHQQFSAKYQLTVPLLIDEGNSVAKQYGALELSLNPAKIHRTVVGIAKDGTVAFYQAGMPSNDAIIASLTSSNL